MAKKDKKKKREAPSLEEMASVGAQDFGVLFQQDLKVPEDPAINRRGSEVAVYEEIRRHPQCKSTFQQRRLAVTSCEWYVEPGGDAAIDKMAADHLKEQLAALKWDKATRQMLNAVWNGYAVAECMYGLEGNRYFLEDITTRKARRFRFGRNDELRLVTRDKPQGVVLPDNKFWVFRAGAEDDDEAYPRGLGYYCFWPVWMARAGLRFWSLFVQRFAQPTPIAKIPPGSNETERLKVLRMLGDIISGGRIAIPNNIALELLQATHSSGGDYLQFCEYMDRAVSKIVLSQTMTTDDGSSRAQGEVHERVELAVVKSDADELCESFNDGPATWLTEWNFPGAKTPKTWRRVEDPADLNKLAERDTKIFELGYEPTEEYIQETYGTGFRRRVSASAEPPPSPAEPAASFADPTVGPGSASVVDSALASDWEALLGPEVEALEALTDGADTLEQVRERLVEYAQRDPKTVTDSLARVLFSARMAGAAGAELDADD